MIKTIRTIIFLIIFTISFGEDSYKIGDKITLKVDALNISEIKEGLKEFQVDGIKESEDKKSYIVEIRSFKVGENIIKIGTEEIKLNIESNLTGDEREIFMEYENPTLNKLKTTPFPYISILSFLGGGYLLYRIIRGPKRERVILPHEKYSEGMNKLNEKNYQFQISYLLREYIDSQLDSKFLEGIYKKNIIVTEEDINFIKELDYIKFSPNSSSSKERLKERADTIYDKVYSYQKSKEENRENSKKESLKTSSKKWFKREGKNV